MHDVPTASELMPTEKNAIIDPRFTLAHHRFPIEQKFPAKTIRLLSMVDLMHQQRKACNEKKLVCHCGGEDNTFRLPQAAATAAVGRDRADTGMAFGNGAAAAQAVHPFCGL